MQFSVLLAKLTCNCLFPSDVIPRFIKSLNLFIRFERLTSEVFSSMSINNAGVLMID